MPEWEQELRLRLSELRLEPTEREDVITELAGYLEDVYENCIAQGLDANEAQERAWSEFSSSRKLARKIQRAKRGEDKVSNREKQIWLPGLATTGLATILLEFLYRTGMGPTVAWAPRETPALFYLPWLLSLPVLGFAGAYWSRKAGGRASASIVAGIFPSLFYLAFPYLALPLALAVDHRLGPEVAALGWFMFISKWYLLNWAAVPFIALLAGTLPAAIGAGGGRPAPQTAA